MQAVRGVREVQEWQGLVICWARSSGGGSNSSRRTIEGSLNQSVQEQGALATNARQVHGQPASRLGTEK
jgi:hypothetical protein